MREKEPQGTQRDRWKTHLADEVLGPVGDAWLGRELEVDLEDALVGLAVPLRLEGGHPTEELVAQHSQAPHIHIGIVVMPLHHLRGKVVQRPTQRLPAWQITIVVSRQAAGEGCHIFCPLHGTCHGELSHGKDLVEGADGLRASQEKQTPAVLRSGCAARAFCLSEGVLSRPGFLARNVRAGWKICKSQVLYLLAG